MPYSVLGVEETVIGEPRIILTGAGLSGGSRGISLGILGGGEIDFPLRNF